MRCILLTVLVVALTLGGVPSTRAYSTSHVAHTNNVGVLAFLISASQSDYCGTWDSGSHTSMATNAVIQAKIQETANSNSFTSNIPMGGGTFQATCLNTLCNWQWFRGLFYYSQPIFYNGVYFTGVESSNTANPTAKTASVSGSYVNWDAQFPVSWANLSYWGKRLVVLQPSSGKWRNVETATKFTQFVCEFYTYTNSDGANGLIPTFPGGSGIPISSNSRYVYSYCGKTVSRDSQGRWILPKCGNAFPWWAGLIIAVACYIILVALIIGIWCYCCATRRQKEERERQKVIGTEADNTGNIPTQSELGLSRHGSFMESSGGTFSEASESETDSPTFRRE